MFEHCFVFNRVCWELRKFILITQNIFTNSYTYFVCICNYVYLNLCTCVILVLFKTRDKNGTPTTILFLFRYLIRCVNFNSKKGSNGINFVNNFINTFSIRLFFDFAVINKLIYPVLMMVFSPFIYTTAFHWK